MNAAAAMREEDEAPRVLQGNHACALGALAAGCRFYAGYPITPSSEIAERMSRELPRAGGVFVQMEDEIASMAAVIGASAGGVKAMTATSGPGFSLKQENLGYAAAAEIPCVVVDVMRGGPSTGMPTRPAQADVMQARWGTHGDHPVVVLTPASVSEIYTQTARAFALSERYRVPVVVLYDETIGHLVESVAIPPAVEQVERRWASGPPGAFRPYAAGEDGVPAMPRPGSGYRTHTTGLTHGEDGFPTQDPEVVARVNTRLLAKIEDNRDAIEAWDEYECEDAEVLVVAFGIGARAARRAVGEARAAGIRAGLLRPVTLWPFPERRLRALATPARALLVAEMNAGQLCYEVERLCPATPLARVNQFDGRPITPHTIHARIEELAGER